MFDSGSSFQNDLYANIPSMALMFTMNSPIFGNGSFVIQPAGHSEVQPGFPTIPYMPLEAMIYQQQSSNSQVQPTAIMGGSNTGQQIISSSQVAADSTGTPRTLNGSQQTS